jgi:hypothetical protein
MPTYTVTSGDSAARVAGKVYGDQRMFAELKRLNPGVWYPGRKINLPSKQKDPFVSNESWKAAQEERAVSGTTQAGYRDEAARLAAQLATPAGAPLAPGATTTGGAVKATIPLWRMPGGTTATATAFTAARQAEEAAMISAAGRTRLAKTVSLHDDRYDKMQTVSPVGHEDRYDKMTTVGPKTELQLQREASRRLDVARDSFVLPLPAYTLADSPAWYRSKYGIAEGKLMYEEFRQASAAFDAAHDNQWTQQEIHDRGNVVGEAGLTAGGQLFRLGTAAIRASLASPIDPGSEAYRHYMELVRTGTMPAVDPLGRGSGGGYRQWLATGAAVRLGLSTESEATQLTFAGVYRDMWVPSGGDPAASPAVRNPMERQFDTVIANLTEAGEEIPGSWRGPSGYRRWLQEKLATQNDLEVQRDLKYVHSASLDRQMNTFLHGQAADASGRREIEAGDTDFLPDWIDPSNAFVYMRNASAGVGPIGKTVRAQLDEWGMDMPYEEVIDPETGKKVWRWKDEGAAMAAAMDAYGYDWDPTMNGIGTGLWVKRGTWTASGGAGWSYPADRSYGGGGGGGGAGRATGIDPWNWSIRIT